MSASVDFGGPSRTVSQQGALGVLVRAPWPLLVLVVLFLACGVAGGVLLTVPEYSRLVFRQSLARAYAAPFSAGTYLGADQLGRAMEWRLLAGLAISLGTAAAVTSIATVIGLVMGLLGGFFGRTADRIVTVIIDVTWAYPTILLAVVVAGIQGPGVSTVIWALGLTLWAAMARIVRAQVLALREQDFVLAARALGYGRLYIAVRHLVPNLVPIWILMATLFVALTIVAEAGLSFIGLGAQSPTPSLGKTLAEGFSFASSSHWPLLLGSVTIVGLVTSLNAFGDYLRDALDPKGALPGTRALLRPGRPAGPGPGTPAKDGHPAALLEADGVSVAIRRAGRPDVPVLTRFSMRLEPGRVLGIVGESGSGKSVTARALMGLLPPGLAQSGGRVLWDGTDIAGLRGEEIRARRGRFVAMAFQDARASLDPLYTVGAQIAESLRAHASLPEADIRRRVLDMLARVGLSEPATFYDRYPHQLSGGQVQRALLAAVLVLGPKILICDEPTTGLDTTTQRKIVDLVRELQAEMGMAVIWISHDLDLVAEIADEIVVMYAGQAVETGPVAQVLERPAHPYTKGLILSRPDMRSTPKGTLTSIPGTVPEPGDWPPACRFLPRCDRAIAACATTPPELEADGGNRGGSVRCHNPVRAEA